jgi:hypothetical protein
LNIKALRKPQVRNEEVVQLSLAIDDFTRQLVQNPVLSFAIQKQIQVSSTPTDIVHGLERPWKGWFLVRKNATGDVWETAPQTNTSSYLTLTASTHLIVDVYIF